MTKEAMIRARIEPELKAEVESIFSALGLTTTDALTIFYKQVKLNRGLPFEVRLPNKTTLRTFRDTDSGRNIVRTKNDRDLFEKLGL
jgi:DNA-damage-inducible protein J